MTADPLCQHEFDNGALCAADALPDSTRCISHQGDGQPDLPMIEPAGTVASTARAR